MRVAVVSFDGIPDPRVEREILTLIKHGFEVYFVGGPRRRGYCAVFGKKYEELSCVDLGFNHMAVVKNIVEPFISRYAAKLSRVLSHIRPDVVLAVNIAAGYIASKAWSHVVIDNHEYFYMQIKYYPILGNRALGSFARRLRYAMGSLWRRFVYCLLKVEALLAEKHPMIFTNKYAMEDFSRRFNISKKKLFVLKNYPSGPEIGPPRHPLARPRAVYIGSTAFLDAAGAIPFRDISAAISVFCRKARMKRREYDAILIGTDRSIECFRGVGWIESPRIPEFLGPGSIGLAAWRPTMIHRYVNPNKPYLYAVEGAIPLITSMLASVAEDMKWNKYIISESNYYADLAEKIEELLSLDTDQLIRLGEDTMRRARQNLIWERQETTLIDAIKAA